MDRRSFLKLGGVVAASGVMGSCGQAAQKIIPYVIPPDDGINPVSGWFFATTCRMCGSNCGVMVRTVEGRAKKIEGNPLHPINQGGTCARGQAVLQHLYHPERLTTPLKRKGAKGTNTFEPISWDDAVKLFSQKLAAAKSGRSGTFVMADNASDVTSGLAVRLLNKLGSESMVVPSISGEESYLAASTFFNPYPALPYVEMGDASFVLLLGADIVENGFAPVFFGRLYGEMRRGNPTRRGTMVYAGPRVSMTAANADEFVAVNPGRLGLLALGIAREILDNAIDERLLGSISLATLSRWSRALQKFPTEEVAKQTGVSEENILRIADAFIRLSPAVAIAGDDVAAHTNGVDGLRAVEFLNLLAREIARSQGKLKPKRLPQINQDLYARMREHIGVPRTAKFFESLVDVTRECSSGEMKLGILIHTNPVHAAPASLKMGEALSKVEFLAVAGHFLNDTTQYADLILPDHHYLEAWSAQVGEYPEGVPVFNLQQPVVRPLYETRQFGDVLIEASEKAGIGLEAKSTEEFIKAMISRFRAEWPEVSPAFNDKEAWEFLLSRGGWWPEMLTETAEETPSGSQLWDLADGLSVPEAKFDGEGDFNFHLHPYETVTMGDGRMANVPWLLETPEPMTTVVWGSWIEIHPETAKKMEIKEGDILRLESGVGSIEAPAYIYPGIAPDLVAVPFGYGHASYGKYVSGRGANPMALLGGLGVETSQGLAWRGVKVKVKKTGQRGLLIRMGDAKGQFKGEVFGL